MSKTLQLTETNLPEMRPVRVALGRVERAIRASRCPRSLSPLTLHGPTGCGKSFLIGELLKRLGDELPVATTTGRDLGRWTMQPETLTALETARLLVIEDVAALPAVAGDTLATLLDRLDARRVPVVTTSLQGPAFLVRHGSRLRSRLIGGLVLRLPLLGLESRRCILRDRLQRASLRVEDTALEWLVQQSSGSFRQMIGLVGQLASRPHGNEPLPLAEVQRRLADNLPDETTTVEQIVREVGKYYRLTPARLRGKSRQRAVLVPRQVSMFLARTLTDLSLERIGAYFGGRDHATVLHACRKVEQALTDDPHLAGAVQSLRTVLC